ncbi:hypothetical protein HYC85_015681 [Camellia sinensis]|uniref:Uncharacterized protein n=1 Tax=Camellia sinensis TaxID=4442 RepID=A0A7J7GXF5_CAMSI|nr:hypothetical protein HYC85_015681 [Camellia sinensis]
MKSPLERMAINEKSLVDMFIADAYKDGVTRKVTVCVRYVTRWPFKPGYAAPPPMFQLGSIPMNFRYFCDSNIVFDLNVFIKGNWEISRRDPNNPCFIAMVTTEPNFVDPDYDEYAAFESRSLFCCHSVAAIFMVLLILRHTLPILVNGAQDYSFPLFLLLLLRTTGIIVPINIMVKAVNAIKCCQRQRKCWIRLIALYCTPLEGMESCSHAREGGPATVRTRFVSRFLI